MFLVQNGHHFDGSNQRRIYGSYMIQVIRLFQTGGAQPSSGALHRGAMERGAHRGGGRPRLGLLGPQNVILARKMAGNRLTMQGFWPNMVKF